MEVYIKELDKPNLGKCKMNCDEIIDDSLLEFPMVADAFSTNHFTIICGRMGQGKTSLVTQFVKKIWKKCYEKIYVVIPEGSRRSIDNDIFGKHLPPEQIFNDLNGETLSQIVANLEENSATINERTGNPQNSLVLIDDFQSMFKNPEVAQGLERIILRIRHLHCTIVLLQQNFVKLPKPLRDLTQNLILFNLGKSSLNRIFEEIVQTKRDKYDAIIDLAFKKPHDWILINLHKSKKVYLNFDEIIF